ncbi:hypothetical protein C6Q14_34730 [Burkholderia ambifaria]|nr:hypothetical protein C6Q14_34730 [Burkholderia ambifaria]
MPVEQHCARRLAGGRVSGPPAASQRAGDAAYRRRAHRACPPCTSAMRLLTSFKRPIGRRRGMVACASVGRLRRRGTHV